MSTKTEDQSEQGKDVDDLIKNYGVPPSDAVKERLLQTLEVQRHIYIIMEEFRQNSQDLSR
jgi:hypothetical protein